MLWGEGVMRIVRQSEILPFLSSLFECQKETRKKSLIIV
jgi:hypothetical protein